MITPRSTKYEGGVAVRGATNAFQDTPAERLDVVAAPAVAVSVYLASEMQKNGSSAHDLVNTWGQEYGVVSITARDARNEDQGIVRWPTDKTPEHAMIFSLNGPKKTSGQSKRLARASKIVIPPR